MDSIEEKLERLVFVAFHAGMHCAAGLKWHCEPNECDGVDAMKKVIREQAENLKAEDITRAALLSDAATTQEKIP